MAIFQIETKAGPTVLAGTKRLVPFAQVIRVNFPGTTSGGIIWNRPISVLVQEPDGTDRNLPIPDVTRQTQLFLLGLGVFGAFLIWAARRAQRQSNVQENE